MELCKAFDSPLLLLGRAGGFQPGGARKSKRSAAPCQSHRMLMLNNYMHSQLQVRNFVHKMPFMSMIKGNFKRPACMGLCKVSWTVEADIEDGQLLYITGDPVELGSWDPEMAIVLSPSYEHVNLWMTEIKVPSGIHFKYNYFIKEENCTYQDLMWRPGPEFFLSVPLFKKKSESIMVRDLWLKTKMENPPIPTWGSWIDGTQFSPQIKVAGNQASSGGKHEVVKSSESEASVAENFTTNIFSNRSNSSVNDVKLNASDTRQSFTESQQPVEEPWFLRSALSSLQDSSMFCFVSSSDNGESTKIELAAQEHETTDIIRHVDEHKLVHVEKHVSTVILINSSVCTMQRIAILEDGKLVELLLEPVKNNVQCDSVYLGVVTKLVPHMGGAFVDIGITRPSLMDIKPSREPFTYPPFSTTASGQEANGSATVPEIPDVHEDELNLYGSESVSDEILNVDNQEDSLEYEDEDTEENGVEDVMDDSDTIERNTTNKNIGYNGTVPDLGYDYYENEHSMESEVSGEFLSLEMESSNCLDPSDMLLQDPSDNVCKNSDRNKWGHVRKGTKVIVQVVKEGLGTKGPALTAYPNLRSRFWILITQCDRIGVSKKITGAERTRLRVIAKALQPTGFGLTVRTVAAGHSLEELQKDLEGLLSTWKGIIEQAKSAALAADEGVEGAVPVILHRAMGQTLSVVQDYFNDNVESMIVDSPRTYHEVSNYLQDIAPDLCDRVLLYNKRIPLFDDYGIEEEINSILSKRVPLSNGGSLVIEQTEALVSIDVNGGHSMLGQGTSQEKAVLDVNLAAAKRIAQELRLRDIGGIIVVDFIDMADESNKRLVYEAIKKAVERDRSIVKVSELSKHGLMEITRKRVRPSVSFLISEPCTCCHGTGRVEALETSYSKIEREICRLLASDKEKADPGNAKSWPRFVLKVDRYMCNYLTSGKRTKLAVLSSSLKVWILLKVARGFSRGAFEIKPFADDRSNDETPVSISSLQHTEARPYISNSRLTLFPIKKWKTRGR